MTAAEHAAVRAATRVRQRAAQVILYAGKQGRDTIPVVRDLMLLLDREEQACQGESS